MSEFKVIETQEELNAIIGKRLEREKETIQKQYEGYMSPEDVQEKYKGYLSAEDINKSYVSKDELKKQLDEKDSKIKGYEIDSVKTRIALKNGFPVDAISRINGTTEDEIQADVEGLMKMFNVNTPIGSTEPSGDNTEKSKDIAYAKLAQQLNGGN